MFRGRRNRYPMQPGMRLARTTPADILLVAWSGTRRDGDRAVLGLYLGVGGEFLVECRWGGAAFGLTWHDHIALFDDELSWLREQGYRMRPVAKLHALDTPNVPRVIGGTAAPMLLA